MYEQTQKIRKLVTHTAMYQILIKDGVLWDQMCSCLDVIDDTELAITAYQDRKFGGSTEELYVVMYGLLQILVVQQDAVKYLCESLQVLEDIYNNPRLQKIREIRNDTIGHPTKLDRDKKRRKSELPSYHHISRITLNYNGFQYISNYSNGETEFKNVSIPDLIRDQRTCLPEILTSVIVKLERREKDYKEEFKMEKLISFLPDTTDHDFEKIMVPDKIMAYPDTKISTARGALGLQHIKQVLQGFREALDKRSVKYESIDLIYEELEYPLAELEQYYQNAQNGKEPNINEKTVYIFAFFVKEQVNELKSMAQEIDEDYSS